MSFFTRDIMSHLDAVEALTAAAISATTNGVVVDTHDYNSVAFLIQVAAVTNLSSVDYISITAEEGDEAGAGDFAAIPTNRRLGPAIVLNASAQANSVLETGYAKGTKRYMRLVFTETAGNSGVTVALSALALLGAKDTSWSPRS
jgi:hypothetical protein